MVGPNRGKALAFFALLTVLLRGQPGFAKERSTTRAPLVAEIAFQYAALDRAPSAVNLLNRALSITETDQSDCYKSDPLVRIANGYTLAGQTSKGQQLLARAFQIAREQTLANCRLSATSPEESLLNRAIDYAEAGQTDFALEIIRAVDNWYRPIAMVRIAEAYRKDQKLDQSKQLLNEAITIAQRDPNLRNRRQVLISIAAELTRTGQLELLLSLLQQTLDTIRTAPQSEDTSEWNLTQTLQITHILSESGQKSKAIAVLNQVVPEIRAFRPREFPSEKVNLLSQAAVQYAAVGDSEQAKAILAIAESTAQALKASDRNLAATQVARSYAEIGQIQTARKLATQLKELVDRESVFRAIAVYYIKSGQQKQAVQIARSLSTARNLTLTEIVDYYLFKKQYDQALSIAQQERVHERLPNVALAYAEAGKPEQALKVVQFTRSRNNQTNSLYWLMPSLAEAFAKQGQFEQALQIAQAVQQKKYKSQALSAIATQYIAKDRIANRAKAAAILDQALKVALSIEQAASR